MDARRWSGRAGGPTIGSSIPPHLGDLPDMTPAVAALGVLLVIVAIPFGFMLAPLPIGILLVWFGLRRLGGVLEPLDGTAAS